jgi:hypothetical protein
MEKNRYIDIDLAIRKQIFYRYQIQMTEQGPCTNISTRFYLKSFRTVNFPCEVTSSESPSSESQTLRASYPITHPALTQLTSLPLCLSLCSQQPSVHFLLPLEWKGHVRCERMWALVCVSEWSLCFRSYCTMNGYSLLPEAPVVWVPCSRIIRTLLWYVAGLLKDLYQFTYIGQWKSSYEWWIGKGAISCNVFGETKKFHIHVKAVCK